MKKVLFIVVCCLSSALSFSRDQIIIQGKSNENILPDNMIRSGGVERELVGRTSKVISRQAELSQYQSGMGLLSLLNDEESKWSSLPLASDVSVSELETAISNSFSNKSTEPFSNNQRGVSVETVYEKEGVRISIKKKGEADFISKPFTKEQVEMLFGKG